MNPADKNVEKKQLILEIFYHKMNQFLEIQNIRNDIFHKDNFIFDLFSL